ncbi:uncharacterized protein N7459_008694 [Penicillium hispanicum]|uniref:uncharacterized protein n=1 Tax=Penicillium hispanicum TaxID=1080232 RepID=UPI00254131C7|nr:uncharacterized protein N7459_008694 [Penicillium hispanicum]KAJ5574267.1 hypothetical protein N7459_008694 [Penicillium hispanicum]
MDLDPRERHKMLIDARERLLSFRRNLDPRLRLTRDVSESTIIFCHMSYHMSQLLIHRPYLSEPQQSHVHRLAVRSMTVEAAQFVRLVRAFESVGSFDKAPPFIVHSVQTAAITLLLNATSTDPSMKNQSISHFRTCFNALEAMGSRWQRARNAINVLRGLAARWNIVRALPMRYSFPLSLEHQLESSAVPVPADSSEVGSRGGADLALWNIAATDTLSAWEDVDPIDFFHFDIFNEDLTTTNFEWYTG